MDTITDKKTPFLEQENVRKVLLIFPKIAFVLGVISCIVVFAGKIGGGFGGKTDPNVRLVLESTREGYGMITYEEAFDTFFKQPKWRSFTSTDDETIVECSGKANTNEDMDIEVIAQFTLYPEEDYFELSYLEYNQIPQNVVEKVALLNATFDSYVYDNSEES